MAKTEVYRVGQYVPANVPDTAPGSGVSLLENSGVPLALGILNAVTVTRKGEDNYPRNASVDLGAAWLLPVTIAGGVATPNAFGVPVYLITATGLLSTAGGAGTKLFGALLEESPVANGTQVLVVVKVLQPGTAAA